jgi:superoxide reductase
MLNINKYVDISTLDKEAKKDYIDRHSAFIDCETEVVAGEMLAVTVRVGDEYAHPDDFDHYISYVQLYNGQTLLGQANFEPGAVFGNGGKGNLKVTFHILAAKNLSLTAMAYCTKHGLWESDTVKVSAK